MNKEEAAQFCAFFRRSRYDMVQARKAGGWGAPWTFAPCDPSAAVRAALMLRRAGVRDFRHARRACLKMETMTIDAVVFTELPSGRQTILRIIDGLKIKGIVYLRDECLEVLEAVFDSDSWGHTIQ